MVLSEVMINILVYLGILLFGMMVMNFATMGLPMKVLNVRASLGKKAVVFVKSMTGFYYTTGVFDGSDMLWKARNDKRGEKRRIDLKKAENEFGSVLFRSWGVMCVCVDEESNAVLTPMLKGVGTHDAIKVDHLIKRAIMAPKIQNRTDVVIIILLVLVLLGVAYVGYQTIATQKLVQALSTVKGSVV